MKYIFGKVYFYTFCICGRGWILGIEPRSLYILGRCFMLNYFPSPFKKEKNNWDRVLLCFSGWPWTFDPLASTSQVAGIMGMLHCTQLKPFFILLWLKEVTKNLDKNSIPSQAKITVVSILTYSSQSFLCIYLFY